MTCAQPSLVRQRRPGPVGLGRRTAKSTGTISLPSPMTTSSSTPSMPSTTRLCCPLHHVPTNSSLLLYFRKTESSSTHVHCQRLRVASLIVSMWRQSDQDILTEFAEPLEPGAFGQGAQDARGQVLVPSARAGQLIGIDAAEERGEHEGKDFPEQLLLGSQTAFDLGNEVIGQTEIIESLAQRFDIALGLFLLVFMALLGVEATPFESVGLLFDVSSGAGHGDVLRLRDGRYERRRTPCPMWERNGNEILRAPTYRYK